MAGNGPGRHVDSAGEQRARDVIFIITNLKYNFPSIPKSLSDKNGMLTIVDKKPVTFYVLIGEFSSKGMWYHPVGVSLGGQEADRLLGGCRGWACRVCERIREMERQGLAESYIFKIRGPLKYAVNVVVKAEETPRVFLATQKVGEEIIEAWAGMLERT
jgi:hypothetical protein